jgi:hypothetical protein
MSDQRLVREEKARKGRTNGEMVDKPGRQRQIPVEREELLKNGFSVFPERPLAVVTVEHDLKVLLRTSGDGAIERGDEWRG